MNLQWTRFLITYDKISINLKKTSIKSIHTKPFKPQNLATKIKKKKKKKMHYILQILSTFLVIILSKFIHKFIWMPIKFHHHFKKQGINGPAYRLIVGNTLQIRHMFLKSFSKSIPLNHNILHRVVPFYHQWSNVFGNTFVYWFGPTPRLTVSDPALIKEVLNNSSGAFQKIEFNPSAQLLVGGGLVAITGDKWTLHRKIANQAFKSYFVSPKNLQISILDFF